MEPMGLFDEFYTVCYNDTEKEEVLLYGRNTLKKWRRYTKTLGAGSLNKYILS